MRKYKRRKPPYLKTIAVFMLAVLFTMSIGYSLFTDTLYIRGTANAKPVELTSYTIVFNENGGSGSMESQVFEEGELKRLSKNIFQREDYTFDCWNTKPDGTGTDYFDMQEISNLAAAGETVNLYAIWDRYQYFHDGPYVFDGTNHINTEVKLFSERNVKKDFIVKFTINSMESNQNYLAVLFGDMNEKGVPYPGIVIRIEGGSLTTIANVNTQVMNNPKLNFNEGMQVVLKRERDIYSYSIDGGITFIQAADYSNFSYPFDAPATFGSGLDDKLNPFRFFKGTLSNMSVVLKEIKKYSIIYDANGGTGTVDGSEAIVGENVEISSNSFTREGKIFDCWNTKADGTGTDYEPGSVVSSLGEADEVVTLYAKWRDPGNYNVIFHSNTSSDETKNQEMTENETEQLETNTFTNQGKHFLKWNTMPDGSGTDYIDGAEVKDLTAVGGEFNLYAIWVNKYYENKGEIVFNGSNNINTGIYLFNQENATKDFEISFELKSHTYTANQATIMCAMDESGSPWPGMVFRVSNNNQDEFIANVTDKIKVTKKYNMSSLQKVTIKRINGIIYVGTNDGQPTQVLDMTTLTQRFDAPLVFGSSMDGSGNPWRYFQGTLANIKVIVY